MRACNNLLSFSAAVGINFALEGTAAQSSTYVGHGANLAIDGNADSNFDHKSCSHTNMNLRPWWMVTFKKMVLVRDVVIVNRAGLAGK